MVKQHFYLLSALPDLKNFRSVPPVTRRELLSMVIESNGPTDVIQALFLSDDLQQREAILAGEIDPDRADLAFLSLQQAKAEEPLPDFLRAEPEDENASAARPIAVDPFWRNYFHFAVGVARRTRTRFLQEWVEFEVGLRNALAEARAEALELDPGPYRVAPELGNPDIPFAPILAEWAAALNPLEAVATLDRARWNWLTGHERWYSFNDDEVAAYTAKLMILLRWQRIAGEAQ